MKEINIILDCWLYPDSSHFLFHLTSILFHFFSIENSIHYLALFHVDRMIGVSIWLIMFSHQLCLFNSFESADRHILFDFIHFITKFLMKMMMKITILDDFRCQHMQGLYLFWSDLAMIEMQIRWLELLLDFFVSQANWMIHYYYMCFINKRNLKIYLFRVKRNKTNKTKHKTSSNTCS